MKYYNNNNLSPDVLSAISSLCIGSVYKDIRKNDWFKLLNLQITEHSISVALYPVDYAGIKYHQRKMFMDLDTFFDVFKFAYHVDNSGVDYE